MRRDALQHERDLEVELGVHHLYLAIPLPEEQANTLGLDEWSLCYQVAVLLSREHNQKIFRLVVVHRHPLRLDADFLLQGLQHELWPYVVVHTPPRTPP